MTEISARPADLPLVFVAGDDFGFAVTVLENGVAYVSTGATVETSITSTAGVVQATNLSTGWASNVLTVGLTDTETVALGLGTYRYSVSVTKAGVERTWFGGFLQVLDRQSSAGTSSTSATLSIDTSATVAIGLTIGSAGPPGAAGAAGAAGEGVAAGGTTGQVLAKNSNTDYDTEWITAAGTGDLLAANNLSELTATASTARTNLGLGTAATQASGAFATAAQGATADTTATGLSNHLADATDAHAASAVGFTPVGTIAASNVQTAIAEVATDYLAAIAALSSTYQPLDSDLTSIAALSTTAYGRAFLALADQAATMALLSASSATASGIVELATSAETITGTDTVRAVTPAGAAAAFQPLDADLTSIAAVATTAYGRAFLALANQAATMALLSASSATASGIVELATDAEATTGTDTVRATTPANVKAVADLKLSLVAAGAAVENLGAVESNVNTVAATGSTETLDTSVYGVHDCTMDQSCTFTFSNPAPSGKLSSFVLVLRGAFTPTLPAAVKWSGGAAPTYTTPSVYTFTTVDAGTTWLAAQVGRAFA